MWFLQFTSVSKLNDLCTYTKWLHSIILLYIHNYDNFLDADSIDTIWNKLFQSVFYSNETDYFKNNDHNLPTNIFGACHENVLGGQYNLFIFSFGFSFVEFDTFTCCCAFAEKM